MYCKPTIILDDFFSQFTRDELVCGNYFCNQVLSTPVFFLLQLFGKYWSAAKNIRDNEALVNLAKISCTQIIVGLQ